MKVNWVPNYRYDIYSSNSEAVPTSPEAPVDIVKMAYREPNVTTSDQNRIAELEERVKELESLVLQIHGQTGILESDVTELRTHSFSTYTK